MPAGGGHRVLVVGGGITGLATAEALVTGGAEVTVREAAAALGGKIRTSTFAGLAIDEGADAFLARTPEAVELAGRVGLADLTAPTDAAAAVWYDGLHGIPGAIVLGVPAGLGPFVTTRLLSWRGKLRAACEPFLPRTPTTDDVLGAYVRRRFGDEVHERLVDALVGSIYATDTDNASLAAVPQLAELAANGRSLLLSARSARARASRRPATGPLFAAPRDGVGALVEATAAMVRAGGGDVRVSSPVVSVERDDTNWVVDGERYDAIALTSPARASAPLLADVAPEAGRLVGRIEHADVIIVTMSVPGGTWPERLRGMSGYLVPKPVQQLVTAASFGSQKWAHWRPADGSEIVRVSIGRDGLGVDHLDDDAVVAAAVEEVGRHLAFDLQPSGVRISRWRDAFPQYRPHHLDLVGTIEAALPAGLVVAGAGYRGIGIPACIRQAGRIAEVLLRRRVEGIR
jgi:protoporphyrinogen/coproporphyrinogen III oxidase